MSFNENQEHAVNWNGDLIVSAAAGAGKTTVLTRRVIRLIREGTGLDEMLILTFTRAAAAEMKSRIEKNLMQAEQEETDPDKKRYWQRQLLLCPNACISTIDSFCSSVVRRHYYRADLAPAMTPLSETEQAILLDESFSAAAAEMAVAEPEQLHVLFRSFRETEKIKDEVVRLHSFLGAQPDRDKWLADTEAACREGRLTAVAEEKLFRNCLKEMEAAVDAFHRIRYQLPEYAGAYGPYADAVLPVLRSLKLSRTTAEYAARLAEVTFPPRLPIVGKNKDIEGICPVFKQLRDTVKNTVSEHLKLFAPADEEETGNEAVTGIVSALLTLLRRTEADYAAVKLEKGKIDYADMEYYAVRLLSIPEVAEEYRRRFRTVIVDEYQDSNRLQEAILDSIRRPGGLFLVGDVKQSIYGFRNAVPDLFNEKTDRYGRGEDNGRRIDLNCNFRSSKEVLDAVNGVFSRLMTAETGALTYDDSQALHPGDTKPEGKAALVLIECQKGAESGEDDQIDKPEAEALWCAQKIREIMEKEIYTDRNGVRRPYTYRDFTILLRNRNFAAQMIKILTEEGIPCFAETKGGYFESIEVQLFMNVLRIIDNRRQDIPLLSVMRSMVGGFSDEELIALRRLCPDAGHGLLDCLLAAAEQTPGGKADAFLTGIETWRQKSLYMPARELCSLLLDETGLLKEMSMLPNGRQREANLKEALSLANEYDASGAFGLHGFLRYIDKAREKDKTGSASTVSGDVVRIMTVHKSKGLEFPVVFYCNLAGKFSDNDTKRNMLLDEELGIGIKYTDEGNIKREPRLYQLLKKRIGDKDREEEMRVLYVGMTRAERQLYMVGCINDWAKTAEKLPSWPTAADMKKANNALKWLLLTQNEALPLTLVDAGVPHETAVRPELGAPDAEKLSALSAKLARTYPWPAPVGVPNKTSATALSGFEKEYAFNEEPFGKEGAEESAQASALKHGTDIHALLKKLPLAEEKKAAREALFAKLSDTDREALTWFTGTSLFDRMQASPLCRRELPFTASVESGTLPGLEKGEQVLLQGVIDCCFTEGEGYVVLDYKTDRFRGKTAEEQAQTHREQVGLYARVLSRLTQKPVTEQYVVFLSEKTIVRL